MVAEIPGGPPEAQGQMEERRPQTILMPARTHISGRGGVSPAGAWTNN